MELYNGAGDRDNDLFKRSPIKKDDKDGHTTQGANNNGSHSKCDPGKSRPVQIKSTTEALNAISDPQAQQWFVARTNESNEPTGWSHHVVDYENEANRLASFVGHWPANAVVSPSELVKAGLFYTGPGDKVKCAYCRGGLYNWTEGDTAIGEHIRHFPQCEFIQNKMAELVHMPQGGLKPSPSTKPSKDNVHDTAKQIVTDMGYSEELVQRAMEKLTLSEVKVSVDKLLDVVFEMESKEGPQAEVLANDKEEEEEEEKENLFEITKEENTAEEVVKHPDNKGYGSPSENQENVQQKDLKELEEENSMLKGKTLCKICMDAEVSVLFLPCRHLVCCEACSSMVKNCPVCRTLIVGTVNTYLA